MSTSSASRSAAGYVDDQDDSPDAEPTPSKARRVTVSAACNVCRKRKIRCDGERPTCASCRKSGRQECEYDTALAETHGQARKRRHAELQSRNEAYRDIYVALKVGQDDSAQGILRQIRSGADVEALLANLNYDEHTKAGTVAAKTETPTTYEYPYEPRMPAALTGSKNPYLASILYEKVYLATPRNRQSRSRSSLAELPQMYHTPYHAVEMVDPRIDMVRAAPWTTVTPDNGLVQQLLRLYFVFVYPCAPCFHKDFFLEDLIAGRARFCSPLLLHTILAAASRCHGVIPDRAEYWRPRSLGYEFLAEAKRLWELERDVPQLTTAQAGMIIAATSTADGVDKVGSAYLAQSVAIGRQLGLFSKDEGTTKRKMRLARSFTAWGLFTYQSAVSYHFHRAPLLSAPPEEPLLSPADASLHYPEIWLQYPQAENAVAASFGSAFIAAAEFGVIVNEIAKAASAVAREGERFRGFRLEETLRYHQQLNEWYEGLTDQLSTRQIVLPLHFKIHMYYWAVLIDLFDPLVRLDFTRARTSLSNLLTYEQPDRVVEHSHRCLEMLIRLYFVRHGFESSDASLISPLTTVGFRALRSLRDAEAAHAEEWRAALSTLILCAKGLRDQGQNHFVSEAIYRLVRARMNALDPAAVFSLDEAVRIEDDDERDELIAQHISSAWPVAAAAGPGDDFNMRRLQDVFRDVSRMDLDGSSEGGSGYERSSESMESA